MPIIFHLDLDAFFISVERILNPQLNGKPVIVGGNPQGRGVVAACSYEARAFGLQSGMPIRQAFKLCPQGLYIRGSYEEYVRFSRLTHERLIKAAPQIQKASIDEFYMDFTGCARTEHHYIEIASSLQRDIMNTLHLPCSIGIGTNKTIAKIGSDFNKPLGITYILPDAEKAFLAPLPISKMPGIGKVLTQNLNSKGFIRLGDIANMTSEYFTTAFGKYGADIWEKANGRGSTILTTEHEQKSISKECTFSDDITEMEVLKHAVFEQSARICQSLRDMNMQASTVHLKLRYSDFQTLIRSKTIEFTNDDGKVFHTAYQLLEKAHTRRVGVRLVGVGISNFSRSAEQMKLFHTETEKKQLALSAINEIRGRYGFDKISYGVGE